MIMLGFLFTGSAMSAKRFKSLTNDGANFRMTMVKLKDEQANKLDEEIADRMNAVEAQ